MPKLRVIANTVLSPGTFLLRLERPAGDIRAGQCFSLGTSDLGINREYSMYSGSKEPFLDFLIRKVDGGIVSSRLAKAMPGEEVEVSGPFGEFCLNESLLPSTKFIFIASGTGIAPFHSFVQTFENLRFTLIHGVRTSAECYESDTYPTGSYIAAISQSVEVDARKRVTDVLKESALDHDAMYYLCGNRLMITDSIAILRDKGVPGRAIFTESFF